MRVQSGFGRTGTHFWGFEAYDVVLDVMVMAKGIGSEETARVFEISRHEGLVLSKSGPYKSVLRMVPPLCLSLDDVEFFAQALDRCFAQL